MRDKQKATDEKEKNYKCYVAESREDRLKKDELMQMKFLSDKMERESAQEAKIRDERIKVLFYA